jgi:hypothetical protein
MNCRQYQAQISDALANGSEPLPDQLAAHVDSCSPCWEFHTKQQALFHSIDTELQCLVNQSVPPSLLPVVRDRIGQNVQAHRWSSSAGSLLAATAALIIVFVLAGKFHSSIRDQYIPQNAATPSPSLIEAAAPQPTTKVAPVRQGSISRTRPPSSSPEISKVIVLAEEQKAFTRFLSEVPEHQQATLALTRPTTLESVVPVEIAPLHIATLEVGPLEGSEAE